MTDKPRKAGITDAEKKASLERLVQQYHQAKIDQNTLQIKRLESVLKRLGYTKFR